MTHANSADPDHIIPFHLAFWVKISVDDSLNMFFFFWFLLGFLGFFFFQYLTFHASCPLVDQKKIIPLRTDTSEAGSHIRKGNNNP